MVLSKEEVSLGDASRERLATGAWREWWKLRRLPPGFGMLRAILGRYQHHNNRERAIELQRETHCVTACHSY